MSCVDDKYDLDDIDKDYEIKVDDLVLPVKLDAFELSSVFNLDDNSVIKELGDEYAVVFDGEFKSDPIKIEPVTLSIGQVDPINTNVFSYSGSDIVLPGVEIGEQAVAYEVGAATTSFKLAGVSIDNCLRQLDVIKGDCNITFDFNLKDQGNLFKAVGFEKLRLKLPQGFKVTEYTADENGVIVIPELTAVNGHASIALTVSEIDATKLPAGEYTFTAGPGTSPSSLSIDSYIGIDGGIVVAVTNPTTPSAPQQVDLGIVPTLSDVHIKSISGKVEYHVSDLNISDLELTGLPDFLTQAGTNITLSNPQLYLAINNPLAGYKLEGETGLSLGAIRNDQVDKTVTLPSANNVVIGFDKGQAGPYNFCLAPVQPANMANGTKFLAFPEFGTLLSGEGLPSKIKVDFIDPKLREGYVTDFLLGQTLEAFKGEYSLTAPLAFEDGSQIVYEDRETGWNDETLLKLTVSQLQLTATITNPLPVDIVMTGYPLDENGNHVTDPSTGKPVQLVDAEGNLGFTIKAGTTHDILLRTDGTFNGIDGISYEARCSVAKPGVSLNPSSTIKVENIRATVSGSYRDSF
ncbi:MAG: hypothetical protein K2K55_00690 [Duncaniella sp.]|nr:hypothetical protein [Duncaniella sp.]